jgi:hypothetical protein
LHANGSGLLPEPADLDGLATVAPNTAPAPPSPIPPKTAPRAAFLPLPILFPKIPPITAPEAVPIAAPFCVLLAFLIDSQLVSIKADEINKAAIFVVLKIFIINFLNYFLVKL